jgi:outer membrane murein-binding lipoprotein Lpp
MRVRRLGGPALCVGLVVLATLVTAGRVEKRQETNMASNLQTGTTTVRPTALPPAEEDPNAYYPQADGATDPGAGAGYIPPQRELASSPEWLAYLNALGVQEQALRADTDKMRGLYQSDAQRQLQELPAGYIQQRRGITGSMEGRGMARSGEFLRRLAENRATQGRAESAVNAQLGFQVGSLESQLAQKLVDLNTSRAQQEATMRANGYV